jgi:hypothetical protein
MEAVGLIAAIGASALVIEKVVSFIRRAFDASNRVKTFWWNALALLLGVAYALGWQLNFAAAAAKLIPALATSGALDGVSGQVLTGLVVGAAAGFWYAAFQALEATVHRNNPS